MHDDEKGSDMSLSKRRGIPGEARRLAPFVALYL